MTTTKEHNDWRTEGLSPGYFRLEPEGPVYRMAPIKGRKGEFEPQLVCSPLKALYRLIDENGEEYALVVRVTDPRGDHHDVQLPLRKPGKRK